MASPSKEDKVLRLILENSPLREWHFEKIVQETKVTRAAANKWLKKYVKIGLLKKVKLHKKFPYFTAGINNPVYHSQKKIYALDKLYYSGLISHLLSMKEAETIILFGSIVRGDWYHDSDKNYYELKLGRHIELQWFRNQQDLQLVRIGLIRNIINGYVVKGKIQDLVELKSKN